MSNNFSPFAKSILDAKYAHTKTDGTKETWDDVASRVANNVFGAVKGRRKNITALAAEVERLIRERKFIPGGRYLAASGRPYHQVQNCLLLRPEDSREGWADHMHKNAMGLMSGAGLGSNYSLLRERGAIIKRTGGVASGPVALMEAVNDAGRQYRQGGNRRSALWAGLNWQHPDIMEFILAKNWSKEVRSLKEKDFNFPARLDGTNISVGLDDEFFRAISSSRHSRHSLAHNVYWTTIRQMLKTGEPGFSIDIGDNAGEDLRNACTEVSSKTDSDICNLGSINLARIESLAEMKEAVELATAFLVAGTVYSDVPYAKVGEVREQNRRLGLGLMGIHEWLLKRGYRYEQNDELEDYLHVYKDSTSFAHMYEAEWDLSKSVKTRAIAPTGTIGIIGETTTGIEPIFCVAYKRRYLKGNSNVWHYQYVVDPTAKRLIDSGVKPELIEDAYSLDNERRVKFQAWVQKYVDHGISSTINLAAWGSADNNEDKVQPFGEKLLPQLPYLRGITCYPDGARGGQPLTPVSYRTASSHVGEEYEERPTDVCDITKGGTCGE